MPAFRENESEPAALMTPGKRGALGLQKGSAGLSLGDAADGTQAHSEALCAVSFPSSCPRTFVLCLELILFPSSSLQAHLIPRYSIAGL